MSTFAITLTLLLNIVLGVVASAAMTLLSDQTPVSTSRFFLRAAFWAAFFAAQDMLRSRPHGQARFLISMGILGIPVGIWARVTGRMDGPLWCALLYFLFCVLAIVGGLRKLRQERLKEAVPVIS